MAINVGQILSPEGQGPSPRRLVLVPDVLKKTEADAKKAYEEAGLVPRVVQVETSKSAGTVVDQDPDPDTAVRPRTRATIYVAVAPAPTPADINTRFDRVENALTDVKGALAPIGEDVKQIKDAVVSKGSKSSTT